MVELRKGYNPYLLPPWLRKCRLFLKGCIIPITVFHCIRTIFWPTTADIIILLLLAFIAYLLWSDFI